jgi:hypothetical protein
MDALPVDRDKQGLGYVLLDAYGLKFGVDGNPFHGAGHHIAKVEDFEFSIPALALLQALLQQFGHADRSAIHVSREAMDLRLGKARTDEDLRTAVNCSQWIAQIMDE